MVINDNEIKKIEEFIMTLSKLKKSSKIGLIVAKNIDHALHPTNNIKIDNVSIFDTLSILILLKSRIHQ